MWKLGNILFYNTENGKGTDVKNENLDTLKFTSTSVRLCNAMFGS